MQEQVYLLRCYRYIELNPVRGGMALSLFNLAAQLVRRPADGNKGQTTVFANRILFQSANTADAGIAVRREVCRHMFSFERHKQVWASAWLLCRKRFKPFRES